MKNEDNHNEKNILVSYRNRIYNIKRECSYTGTYEDLTTYYEYKGHKIAEVEYIQGAEAVGRNPYSLSLFDVFGNFIPDVDIEYSTRESAENDIKFFFYEHYIKLFHQTYNIPNNIIYERFFGKRPEVIAVYLCMYQRALLYGGNIYTSPHGGSGSITLDRDQGVCTRDYISEQLQLSDNIVKSALHTLENYGYIIKVVQDKVVETVYKIPAICDAIAGTFSRLELPDVTTLWQRGKYLLSTLLYIGISANTDDTHDHYAKTITDDGIVRRGSLITNYDSICYYVGCTYNVARSVVATLKEMQLITCDGYKRLGLYIQVQPCVLSNDVTN